MEIFREMLYSLEMAVKLKDGFFLGDEFSARDIDFLLANKIKRIVNCGTHVPDWRGHGIATLTFNWVDNDSQIILDIRDQVIREVIEFLNQEEGVLICSERGQSRSVTIAVAYFMYVFKWSLNKTLEYVQSRKECIAIKPGFHRQLVAFERRLNGQLSRDWQTVPMADEHLVVHNTFLNSQKSKRKDHALVTPKGQKIMWRDMIKNMSLEIGPGVENSRPRKSILKTNDLVIPSVSPLVSPAPMPRYMMQRAPSPSMRRPVFNGEEEVAFNFPKTPQVKYYARPPSPMVRSRATPVSQQPTRTPSPARSFRSPSPARVSFNNSPNYASSDNTFGMRISVDKPRSLIASQLRRSQAPMVTSLDRPQSTPLWRLR